MSHTDNSKDEQCEAQTQSLNISADAISAVVPGGCFEVSFWGSITVYTTSTRWHIN